MRTIRIFATGSFMISALLLAASASAPAQTLPATLNIHVGYGAGGGYDANARLLARHFGRHLPGEPTVVVQNMPGAGGMRVANWIYNVAPADGSAIAITGTPNFFAPLLGGKGAQFDARKFAYVGSLAGEAAACAVWHTAGVKTFDDLRHIEITAAASGPSSVSTIYVKALNAVLGARMKIVQGYTGSAQALLAMERGEAQAFCGWARVARPDWVRDGKVILVTQIGLTKDAFFPQSPLALDFAANAQDRQTLELIFAPQQITRPYVAPPAIAPRLLTMLREGMKKVVADPAFRAEAEKMQSTPDLIPGEEIASIVERLYASDPAIVKRASALLAD